MDCNWIEFNVPVDLDGIGNEKYLKSVLRQFHILTAFGWHGCVLNMRIDNRNFKNLNRYVESFPKFISLLEKKLNQGVEFETFLKIPIDQNPFKKHSFKIYSRFTIVTDIKNYQQFIRGNALKEQGIDVVVIEPVRPNHMSYVAESVCIDCISLVSLTSIVHVRKQIVVCQKRNIMIELQYHKALVDQSSFYSFFSKFSSAVRATKAQSSIIVANGTSDLTLIRSPHDVANLSVIFGLDKALGKRSISSHVLKALDHGEVRKSIKGVIKITSKDFMKKELDVVEEEEEEDGENISMNDAEDKKSRKRIHSEMNDKKE